MRKMFAGAVLVGAGLFGPAVVGAAAPELERIVVDEEFEDEILSEECGVPGDDSSSGPRHPPNLGRRRGGRRRLNTINLGVTSTGGDRTRVPRCRHRSGANRT